MFRCLESLVDPYCDYVEEDQPPRTFWPFIKRYALPFKKVFVATGLITKFDIIYWALTTPALALQIAMLALVWKLHRLHFGRASQMPTPMATA